jgi:hypothetical protein
MRSMGWMDASFGRSNGSEAEGEGAWWDLGALGNKLVAPSLPMSDLGLPRSFALFNAAPSQSSQASQ